MSESGKIHDAHKCYTERITMIPQFHDFEGFSYCFDLAPVRPQIHDQQSQIVGQWDLFCHVVRYRGISKARFCRWRLAM